MDDFSQGSSGHQHRDGAGAAIVGPLVNVASNASSGTKVSVVHTYTPVLVGQAAALRAV